MKVKKPPIRKCIACNKHSQKSDLIRVVKSKDLNISIDLTGRMNGRGAYFCEDAECLKLAKKKNSLAKAFEMKIEPEIYDDLIGQLNDKESNGNHNDE